jgi:hypothetical protein
MSAIINLSDRSVYSTLAMRDVILKSLQRATTDWNYMPVTRDLSLSKAQMLIRWLGAGAP